jgi:RNA polymerase sigma-70 factor (ECF subfamily)
MDTRDLIPHLFRTEYRKIVSVLGKRFGFEHLETAEDITSDTFLTASQSWGVEGIPENPTAWLYQVAKNKALNFLHRQNHFDKKIFADLESDSPKESLSEVDLSPQNIIDSQLKMMFAICHPMLSQEAQIGLSLRILCGFGIEEIANAFLTNKDTINKRLFRAKQSLRNAKINIDLVEVDIDGRLPSVIKTIYLLFNEGYYSISQARTLRKDLCLEAMRLCTMLIENESTNTPEVNALLSLMCFHFSRFEARLSIDGEIILYNEQDTTLWNTDFISKGGYFLNRAMSGDMVSRYHLEAAIAYWNCQPTDSKVKWENILHLYNQLLQIEYSPAAALNRTYALSKAKGKESALIEAEKLALHDNQFYFALLGELYTDINNKKARLNLAKAIGMAKSPADRNALQKKIDKIELRQP